jgi:hypothetical protein
VAGLHGEMSSDLDLLLIFVIGMAGVRFLLPPLPLEPLAYVPEPLFIVTPRSLPKLVLNDLMKLFRLGTVALSKDQHSSTSAVMITRTSAMLGCFEVANFST